MVATFRCDTGAEEYLHPQGKRTRLSRSYRLQLQNAEYRPVGSCLLRKLEARPYSAYGEECPICRAPIGKKCVGIHGKHRSIPHVPRTTQAAEVYRRKIRAALGGELS